MEGATEMVPKRHFERAVRCIDELFGIIGASRMLEGDGINEFDFLQACVVKNQFDRWREEENA